MTYIIYSNLSEAALAAFTKLSLIHIGRIGISEGTETMWRVFTKATAYRAA